MSKHYTFFLILLCLLGAVPLLGLFPWIGPSRDRPTLELNQEVFSTLIQPKKDKYRFFKVELCSARGLTYSLEVGVSLIEIPIDTPEEAALIHRHIYKEFLDIANTIRSIRPFLAEFPISPNSLWVHLTFLDREKNVYHPPHLSALIMLDGKVRFQQYATQEEIKACIKDTGLGFRIIKRIPVSEAPWLQDYLHTAVPRSKSTAPVIIPTYLHPREWSDHDFIKTQFSFLGHYCETNSLNFVTFGNVGEKDREDNFFNFALRGRQNLDLPSAQKLTKDCFSKFMEFLKTDKPSLEYLKERSLWWKKDAVPETVPEPRHLTFRISFWDENVDRPVAPNIAEIRCDKGKCRYFTADEGQRLVLVHEETLS